MLPGAFGIPSASAGISSLTFGAAANGEDNDEEDAGDDSYSEEDMESDDGVATDPEGALSRGQKRKRQRIRKGQKKPAAGDANFTTASVRGIPFGINMNDIAQEMKKIQTEFMNQDVFQSSTRNADKKEKREELKALYEAIEHYKLMGDSGRVAKLMEKAKAKENEMFGV